MTLRSILSGAVLLVMLVAGGWVYYRIQAGKEALPFQEESSRSKVGDLLLENPDGSRFSLEQYRGKPLIIDVWASWCGPCLRNLPQLVALKNKFSGQIEILGLNVDSEGWQAVERFRSQFPQVNFPLVRPHPEPLIVQTLVTIEALGQVSVLPSAFLIDAEGRLVGKYVGLDQMGQLHSDLEELLEEWNKVKSEK